MRHEVERVRPLRQEPDAHALDSRRKRQGFGDALEGRQEVSVDGGERALQFDQPVLPVCNGLPLVLVQLDENGLRRRLPAQRLQEPSVPLPKKGTPPIPNETRGPDPFRPDVGAGAC